MSSSRGMGRGAIGGWRFSTLDFRLALRLLVKHPGLALVAVTGMALAIAIGAGAFSLGASLLEATLPLPDGDRVVAVRNASREVSGRHSASLRDLGAWRAGVTSVQDVSAFTAGSRNLVLPGAGVDLVRVTRMSASGFRVARTAPVVGRPLLEDDERSDARVVVIAFDEWQRRFAADPRIVGRRIGLGDNSYTIVGVMPDGFHFPVDDRYWIPLHLGPAERERPDAVALTIFGRLADGATIEHAQAELDVVGSRMAAAHPATHGRLRPRVLPYTRAFFDLDTPDAMRAAHLFRLCFGLLVVVVAVNVAMLVYARTATRVGEIVVRTALGASRTRVVTQLFIEALTLSVAAALVGLTIAGVTLAQLQALAESALGQRRLGELPFWVDLRLTPAAIAYALGLAIVGAVIVGVVPALQATGRHVRAGLQQFAGHGARLQLGRAWTALIIAQVTVAVAVLPFAAHLAQEVLADGTTKAGYPAEEFLQASLTLQESAGAPDTSVATQAARAQRFRARAEALIRRIETEPAVVGLTVRRPSSAERIEVDAIAGPGADHSPVAVRPNWIDHVDANFFALYGMPIVAGRAFGDADAHGGGTAVIVNQVFAAEHLGAGSVLGRRIRLLREGDGAGAAVAGPWLDIVGVVRDFEGHKHEPESRLYLPADIAQLSPPTEIAIRVRARPATSFAPRLRELAAAVDPTLQLDGLISAAERHRQGRQFPRYLGIATTAAMLSVLLLSAAGIYAMMAFTVTRRRREIGIRAALGAHPRRVLRSVLARASAQIGAGILFGTVGTVAVDRVAGAGPIHDGNPVVLLLVVGLMATIGVLAALGPARRGLAVEPTEALRTES